MIDMDKISIMADVISTLIDNGFKPIGETLKTEEDRKRGYQVFRKMPSITKGDRPVMGILKVGIKTCTKNEHCGHRGDLLVATQYSIKETGYSHGYIVPFSSAISTEHILEYVNSDAPLLSPVC
jgi:hypothetical protein